MMKYSTFLTLCDTALRTCDNTDGLDPANLHLEQDQFQWSCYGRNATSAILWYRDHQYDWSISVVYGGVAQQVYEFEVWDNVNNWYGRWIDLKYKNAYYSEAFERQVEPNMATDDDEYQDFSIHSDLYERAYDIASGKQNLPEDVEYDTIELDLSDSELALIARAAHAEDITINEFVVRAMKYKLDEVMPDWRDDVKNAY